MTRGKNQHVVKHPGGWAVKGAGNSKATKVTDTQEDATKRAKDIARNQNRIRRFMAVMAKLEPVTAMVTIHAHQRTRNRAPE